MASEYSSARNAAKPQLRSRPARSGFQTAACWKYSAASRNFAALARITPRSLYETSQDFRGKRPILFSLFRLRGHLNYGRQIGRASCRERVEIAVVGGASKGNICSRV